MREIKNCRRLADAIVAEDERCPAFFREGAPLHGSACKNGGTDTGRSWTIRQVSEVRSPPRTRWKP